MWQYDRNNPESRLLLKPVCVHGGTLWQGDTAISRQCNPFLSLASAKTTTSTDPSLTAESFSLPKEEESASSKPPDAPLLKHSLSFLNTSHQTHPHKASLAPYRQGNEVVTGQIQYSSFWESGLKEKQSTKSTPGYTRTLLTPASFASVSAVSPASVCPSPPPLPPRSRRILTALWV